MTANVIFKALPLILPACVNKNWIFLFFFLSSGNTFGRIIHLLAARGTIGRALFLVAVEATFCPSLVCQNRERDGNCSQSKWFRCFDKSQVQIWLGAGEMHANIFSLVLSLRSQWTRLNVDERALTCHPSAARARSGSLRPDPDFGWKTLHSLNPGKEFEAKLIWHCCFMECDCIFFFFTCMLQPFELPSPTATHENCCPNAFRKTLFRSATSCKKDVLTSVQLRSRFISLHNLSEHFMTSTRVASCVFIHCRMNHAVMFSSLALCSMFRCFWKGL